MRALAAGLCVSLVAGLAHAEECTRYVGISTPCVGLAGPLARIVEGRACLPRLAGARAELDSCRRLRTIDQEQARARLQAVELSLAECRGSRVEVIAPAPAPAASWYERPLALVSIGIVIGAASVGAWWLVDSRSQ